MTGVAITDLAQRVDGDVFSDSQPTQKYFTDWRGKWSGTCLRVVRPFSTKDVSEILQWCLNRRIPIVPQADDTGHSGTAISESSINTIVGSKECMNTI